MGSVGRVYERIPRERRAGIPIRWRRSEIIVWRVRDAVVSRAKDGAGERLAVVGRAKGGAGEPLAIVSRAKRGAVERLAVVDDAVRIGVGHGGGHHADVRGARPERAFCCVSEPRGGWRLGDDHRRATRLHALLLVEFAPRFPSALPATPSLDFEDDYPDA